MNRGRRFSATGEIAEAEVDQMVLHFPVMADYILLVDGQVTFFATHGHLFHKDYLPPLKKKGCFEIYGHTHLFCAEEKEDYFSSKSWFCFPLPKEGIRKRMVCMRMENLRFWDFEGNQMTRLALR